MHPRFLISRIMQQVQEVNAGTRDVIEISRLDSKRDYVYIGDVARALQALTEGQPKETVYNLGSGVSTSNDQLIELILNNSKLIRRPTITETSLQAEPLVAIQADISRLREEFGWRPLSTIEEAVKEIIHDADQ